jgi:hypothetical protein
MKSVSMVTAAVFISTIAFAQTPAPKPGGPSVGDKPLVQVKPKAPIGWRLCGIRTQRRRSRDYSAAGGASRRSDTAWSEIGLIDFNTCIASVLVRVAEFSRRNSPCAVLRAAK